MLILRHLKKERKGSRRSLGHGVVDPCHCDGLQRRPVCTNAPRFRENSKSASTAASEAAAAASGRIAAEPPSALRGPWCGPPSSRRGEGSDHVGSRVAWAERVASCCSLGHARRADNFRMFRTHITNRQQRIEQSSAIYTDPVRTSAAACKALSPGTSICGKRPGCYA